GKVQIGSEGQLKDHRALGQSSLEALYERFERLQLSGRVGVLGIHRRCGATLVDQPEREDGYGHANPRATRPEKCIEENGDRRQCEEVDERKYPRVGAY